MELSVKSERDVQIVSIEGRLDTQTSPDAHEQLSSLIEKGTTRVLIDLSDLAYISSAGLRVLLAVSKQLDGIGGDLRVCGLNRVVEEVFEISGFNSIIKVLATQQDALESDS